jgi:hypothetical protein
MAHHKFEILEELLKDIDDVRNDIFLHVDIKAKNFDPQRIKEIITKANLFLAKRIDIHWGGEQQIECVLNLLKQSVESGYHSYYHFMVGVEYPLKNQDYIHHFFDENCGYEFIGFDNYDKKYLDRIKYYHFFNSYARNNNLVTKLLNKIRVIAVAIQQKIGIDRTLKYDFVFKKGNANWSITHDLALHIVSKEKEIKKMYKYSFCCDELFIHTIVYNSLFWNSVYDQCDEYHSSMRMVSWNDPHNQYHLQDIDLLLNSQRLFARKIDGADAMEVIHNIKERREKNGTQ